MALFTPPDSGGGGRRRENIYRKAKLELFYLFKLFRVLLIVSKTA